MAGISGALLAGALLAAAAGTPQAPVPRRQTAPIAKIKESIICCPGDSVLLDGWASIAAGGEIVSWGWDLDGDHEVDTTTAVGEVQVWAPDRPCSRTVYLFVKERGGAVSPPDSVVLHVMNSPPRVTLRSDTAIKVGVRLTFEPRISYNCGPPVRYEWDFTGDGKADHISTESAVTSRVYYKPGRYPATLHIVDAWGREAGGVEVVRVFAEQPPAAGR